VCGGAFNGLEKIISARSIMEGILLDTMFDLPSLEGVEEVVVSKEVVEGTARPLYIYADRADRAGDASAS
jgi:ATP-dependent Clp protease ATP-binding subunit ClpX